MPDLDTVMANCRAAHRRLFETVEPLDDDAVRAPSLLPDWTCGHVLTHLARNADSHSRMLTGALRGEPLEQYAGGAEERRAAIEAGSGRPASEIFDDVYSAALRLEDVWMAMSPEAWEGHGLSFGRIWPCRDMPFGRWREVEVHHADLGVGYEYANDYVAAELPGQLERLPERLPDPQERRRLLAWLLGRSSRPGDLDLRPWQR